MSKPLRRAVFMGLFLLSGAAGAQDMRACGGEPGFPAWVRGGLYSGKLGTLPVTLRLDLKNTEKNAYLYDRKGVNITLTPFQNGQQFILQESVWSTAAGREVVTGCFELAQGGTGLKGRWTTADVKGAQDVTFTPLTLVGVKPVLPSSPELLKVQRTDPFAFLAVNHAWVKVPGGVREPLTGLTYPRVFNGTAAENALLQDRQLSHVLDALDCRSMLMENDDYTYTLNAQITWQTPKLLGLREDVGLYCGGAHPEGWFEVNLYDRTTLKPVDVRSIWPKLTQARLKTLFLQTPDTNPDCTEVIQDEYVKIGAGLSSKGLLLTASGVPHVAAACTFPASVPFSTLKAEANTSSAYYKEIYR